MLGSWMLEPQCTMIRSAPVCCMLVLFVATENFTCQPHSGQGQYPGLAALFKQAAAPEEQADAVMLRVKQGCSANTFHSEPFSLARSLAKQ